MAASMSSSSFSITETTEFDPELVLSVLRGDRACVVFRDFSSADHCRQIVERFENSPSTRRREGDATGIYLGSYHWGKELSEYFADSERVESAIKDAIGAGATAGWSLFLASLDSYLAQCGGVVRKAIWNGKVAASPIIRSWNRAGDYSLIPHEDFAQCCDPKQVSFEIQHVAANAVCSANLCIENGRAGDLILWNRIPTPEERKMLGTTYTGGPYPGEYVNHSARLDLRINAGDLYVFNGALIHAVSESSDMRATVSSLLGYVNDRTVIMWT